METDTAMLPLECQEQEQEQIELIKDDNKLKKKQMRDTQYSKSSASEKHSHKNEERSKEYKVLKVSSDPSTQPEEECLIRSRKRRSDSSRVDCTPSKMAPAEVAPQYDLDWELHKFTADVEHTKQEQQQEDEEQPNRREGWLYDRIIQYVSTNMSTTPTSFFVNYCAAVKSNRCDQLNEEELFEENSDSEGDSDSKSDSESDSENKPKPKKSEELLHSESKANQLQQQQQQQRKEQQQMQLRKCETLQEQIEQKHEDMLKNLQQMLIKLLREVSIEITKELGTKQQKQETFNPNKLDESWCLPYGSDSKVIVNSSKEGIISIRVESLMPMHLRTSRKSRSDRREDDCKPRTEQWCWDNAIEQQSIDPESFTEQQQYKEPTEHYLAYRSLRFQHEIDDYFRQLASDYDNDSEDSDKNNNNTNAVEMKNPFDVCHAVDNSVAEDMELDSDSGSNWSGSKTLCSDKSESTLQLEISEQLMHDADHEWQTQPTKTEEDGECDEEY